MAVIRHGNGWATTYRTDDVNILNNGMALLRSAPLLGPAGNVRELGTVFRETLTQRPGAVITSVDLPAPLRPATPASILSRMESIERHAIQQALAEASGNKSVAAFALGISRKTLHRRIHRYRLDGNSAF